MNHSKTKKSAFCVVCPRVIMLLLACGFLAVLSPFARADAQIRALKIYYVHTNERAEVVFKKNGRYVTSGLKRLNYLLRDWRRNEPTRMDPRLFDLVWQVYQLSGSRDYIHVISAYRSPQTNNMLRLRSVDSGVAKNSQHMLGKAMDFYLPDVNLARLRAIGLRQQAGGVGYYPGSGSPFVHMDVGNVRHWPRMSRGELMALFPDGKTMHIPSDGHPLAHYAEAVAEYRARSGQPTGQPAQVMVAKADTARPARVFSSLLGGSHNTAALPRQPLTGGAMATTGLQAAALTGANVPVPAVSPLQEALAAGTGQDIAVTAYAPQTVLSADIPVPDIKPVRLAMAEKPFADGADHAGAVFAPGNIPVPVPVPAPRGTAWRAVDEADAVADAIRQSNAVTAYAGEDYSPPADDEIGALIARDNFVPLPEEDEGDEEAHDHAALPDTAICEREQAAALGGARANALLAGPRPVMASGDVMTPKTSKALIGKQADNPHGRREEPVPAAVELEQVPAVVFALGLQNIRGRPQTARLSGSAVNFRSVARVADVY